MKLYFGKEILSNSILVAGAKVPFEILNGNTGIIAIDPDKPTDKALITGLQALCGTRGVYAMSEAEYDEKKKAASLLPSRRRSPNGEIRPMPRQRRPSPLERAGVAVPATEAPRPLALTDTPAPLPPNVPFSTGAAPTLPTTVPSEFKPATKKIRRNAAAAALLNSTLPPPPA
jgi:hypothetical protein